MTADACFGANLIQSVVFIMLRLVLKMFHSLQCLNEKLEVVDVRGSA